MTKGLKQLRQEAGLSRYQLARKMDITPNSIYNWETGKVSPSADAIYKMAQIFKTTTDAIFLALSTTKVVRQQLNKPR